MVVVRSFEVGTWANQTPRCLVVMSTFFNSVGMRIEFRMKCSVGCCASLACAGQDIGNKFVCCKRFYLPGFYRFRNGAEDFDALVRSGAVAGEFALASNKFLNRNSGNFAAYIGFIFCHCGLHVAFFKHCPEGVSVGFSNHFIV